MRPAIRMAFTLFFVLVLTSQGFAASAQCKQLPTHAASHCDHSPATLHHGCDGGCCVAAPAAAALPFNPPASISSHVIQAAAVAPAAVTPDRLDRPPRIGLL